MKKRIFAALLVVLILVCNLSVSFAAPAENAQSIKINDAAYDKENKVITITVANTETIDIADSVVSLLAETDKIVFTSGETVSTGSIPAGKEVVVNFPVEVADENALKDINCEVLYLLNKETIVPGQNFTNDDVKNAVFENVLEETAPTAVESIMNFLKQTGFAMLASNWKYIIMILVACVLFYLAIVKKFEPLLLLPIAFGMLLTNLPGSEVFHEELWAGGHAHWNLFDASNAITPGLVDYLYLGVKLGIYPCLIFIGVGAMTDFGPLIANPKSLLLGAAAQLGIFLTYIAAVTIFGFNPAEASSIGIIGGADGPTAIFVTSKLAPHLLGPIAVAAYSYMALVPVIQPPIMKLLTTKKERMIVMKELRPVSKTEKIVFPIVVAIFVALLVPSAAPLVGCLMLGNLLKESGVAERLSKTVQNELMNIVTIFLGVSVGATATAETFLQPRTLAIIAMGMVAFGCGTAGGVLLAKFMNLFLKNKINPLIGSAGVSAVPMAARVSQTVGQKENPKNFLLMHAMGPNVAGVIGSAIAAGVLIALFG